MPHCECVKEEQHHNPRSPTGGVGSSKVSQETLENKMQINIACRGLNVTPFQIPMLKLNHHHQEVELFEGDCHEVFTIINRISIL